MTIRPIICIPDPRLRQVSKPVAKVDAKVRALMDDMMETMHDAPGIGLAAIQIAVPLRVIVIDCAEREDEDLQGEGLARKTEPLFFVNPEIIWTSEAMSEHEEGCLSIPEYFEMVERPAKARVRFEDYHGKPQELHCEGLLATCIQHEVDHLNGVLFIDYLSRLKRDRVMKKFQKAAQRAAKESAQEAT
ncbi:Peptide deformylase [hydrothermal vent metagenome]|uniref:Peptide deformylase n=1 Tax=hydrothermal vent metagenome TaxID=652676 RepID=A0A3B0TER1_9ZZZZ